MAVAALDFAWWGHIVEYGSWGQSFLGFHAPAYDAGAIPMASVLVVGFAHVGSNRGRVPRWLVGFLWGGAAGLLLYCLYGWLGWVLPEGIVYNSLKPIFAAKRRLRWLARSLNHWLESAVLVYFGTPQFLLAGIVGLIYRKKPTV